MESEHIKYGLSWEDWEALSEEDRNAYRSIGEEPNQSSFDEEEEY